MNDDEVWRQYAISYDCIVGIMPYYRAVLDRHERLITEAGCDSVVDVGAGTGNLAVRLADRELSVTAIDSSPAMLEALESKLSRRRRDLIRVVHGHAEFATDLLSAQSFDAATILLALFDMDKPSQAFDQTLKLLKPGGLIVVTEPRRCFHMEPILDAIHDHLERFELSKELEADYVRVLQSNQEIDPRKRENRLWVEDIQTMLNAHGFLNVTSEESHFGQCATVVGKKP